MAFDHERLDVYRLALDFVVEVHKIISAFPPGYAYLADQLQRAATSVPLNIAEGAGEFSPKEKARFYRIAKRSGTESAAVLNVCVRLGILAAEAHRIAHALADRIASMLTRLAQRGSYSGHRSGGGAGEGEGAGGSV
jgi:four helix bundle protein